MSDDARPLLLHAGPLTLAFDRGELRWLRLGDREVLRGIYAAVRPPDWSTVPAALENLEVETSEDGFQIRFDAVHRQDPLWFEWKGALDGTPEGRVRFEMDGVARSTFLRNRIGLCVLHPVEECAGAACSVETTDGETTSGTFPVLVSPHQPFLGLRAIRHVVVPGLEAEVRFEGEVFEMEDQRNWSDASFKTYSTPLALPLPVEVREGERIHQVVTLALHGSAQGYLPREPAVRGWLAGDAVRVGVDRGDSRPVPRIGLGLGGGELVPETVERVRALVPGHLRVDLNPSQEGWRDALAAAARAARDCRTGLEVAVSVSSETSEEELGALAAVAGEVDAPVDAWLVFDAANRTTGPELAAQARERLVPGPPDDQPPLLGGGTDGFFAELNRERSAAAGLDLVCFPLTPQVHAFDDATMVENTTGLGWMAETARSFAAGASLGLSPVTLVPRPGADPRQRTLFAAGWTLGLVSAAAEAGFARMTLFEVQGPGGVLEAGRPLPVGSIMAELASLVRSAPDARVVRAVPSDPFRCLTLAVHAGRLLRVYVFNPTRRSQAVVVSGFPTPAWERRFTSGSVEGPFMGEVTGRKLKESAGALAIRLDGHDLVALDAEVDGS